MNKPRSRSQQLNSQQRLAASTIVLLAGIVLTSMMTAPSTGYSSLKRNREIAYTEIVPVQYDEKKLKSAGKEVANVDYGECVVRPAITPKHDITPTFTASYPGSGAKMTWLLIEAITGFSTGDDFNINGVKNMVSIKTHYPSHEGREVPGAESVPRAMLLLRHPLAAFPSYYNYLYEMENKLENHSTRAPMEAWIAWRDANFYKELQVWRKHCEYWMDRYSPINRLVISYEKMTDDVMGAVEATRIAEFLSRSEGVTTCPPEQIPCIWYKVVKYKKEQQLNQQQQQQQQSNLAAPPKANGQGGNGNESQNGNQQANQQGNQKINQQGNQSVIQQGNQNGNQQTNQNANQPMNQKVNQQGNQKVNQRANQKVNQQANQNGNQQRNQNINQQGIQKANQQGNQNANQQANQGVNQQGNGRRLQQKNQAAPAKKDPNEADPAQFKQSDPTRPNSQRGGPKYVPPYTEQQLKDLMSTLTGMLERYREEKSLAPILVQYIDYVEKRAAKLRNEQKKVE